MKSDRFGRWLAYGGQDRIIRLASRPGLFRGAEDKAIPCCWGWYKCTSHGSSVGLGLTSSPRLAPSPGDPSVAISPYWGYKHALSTMLFHMSPSDRVQVLHLRDKLFTHCYHPSPLHSPPMASHIPHFQAFIWWSGSLSSEDSWPLSSSVHIKADIPVEQLGGWLRYLSPFSSLSLMFCINVNNHQFQVLEWILFHISNNK